MSEPHTHGGDDRKLSLENLWVLMVTAFVDMIGFALILPLLPFYTQRLTEEARGNPVDEAVVGVMVGALVGIYALAQMIAAPVWGRLSDRYGRRPMILTSQAISGLAYLTFAYAESVWVLLACRLLQGVGGGTASVVNAYVSDAVGPDERAKALGWITACTSAGVMVGPAIASFSVDFGYEIPGLIAAGLCGLNILFGWFWLEETVEGAGRPKPGRRKIRQQIGEVLRQPTAVTSTLIWVYAAGMMAFMAMNTILALFLSDRFGVTEKTIGWFYMSVGFVSVIARAVVLGAAVNRFGEVRVLRLGAVLLGLGMCIAPLTQNIWQFLICVVLIPTGTSFLFPSTTSLVSRYADPKVVGQTLGVQHFFGGLCRLIGPLWAGAAFQYLGKTHPFWMAGALVFATALFSLRLKPRRRL